MPIADIVTLIARYWYLPVIVVLGVCLKIESWRLHAAKGQNAPLVAEVATVNKNFASLKSNADACSQKTQELALKLAERTTALAAAADAIAKREKDINAEEATLLGTIDASKSCLQAQQDSVKFYQGRHK